MVFPAIRFDSASSNNHIVHQFLSFIVKPALLLLNVFCLARWKVLTDHDNNPHQKGNQTVSPTCRNTKDNISHKICKRRRENSGYETERSFYRLDISAHDGHELAWIGLSHRLLVEFANLDIHRVYQSFPHLNGNVHPMENLMVFEQRHCGHHAWENNKFDNSFAERWVFISDVPDEHEQVSGVGDWEHVRRKRHESIQ